MRPRRVLLLVTANPKRLLLQQFVLDLWGYRVLPARTAAEAAAFLRGSTPEMLLGSLDPKDSSGSCLVQHARTLFPDLKVILYARGLSSLLVPAADRFVQEGPGSPALLRETLKALLVRKRGPKKRVPAPVLAEAA